MDSFNNCFSGYPWQTYSLSISTKRVYTWFQGLSFVAYNNALWLQLNRPLFGYFTGKQSFVLVFTCSRNGYLLFSSLEQCFRLTIQLLVWRVNSTNRLQWTILRLRVPNLFSGMVFSDEVTRVFSFYLESSKSYCLRILKPNIFFSIYSTTLEVFWLNLYFYLTV